MSSIGDLISNGIYDLTHLEINTIVKSNMTAAKITNSPRKLLHEIATVYHFELVNQGLKYQAYFKDYPNKSKLFREETEHEGSGEKSFIELAQRARASMNWLKEAKSGIQEIEEDEMMEDAMMLERIASNSTIIRDMITANINSKDNKAVKDNLDDPKTIETFRKTTDQKLTNKNDLKLNLQDLLTLKKINDIGTEKILTQTVIGLDGDVTTRISRSYAKHPVTFINEMHQEAITTSVNYWESLIKIFANFITKIK